MAPSTDQRQKRRASASHPIPRHQQGDQIGICAEVDKQGAEAPEKVRVGEGFASGRTAFLSQSKRWRRAGRPFHFEGPAQYTSKAHPIIDGFVLAHINSAMRQCH